MLCLVWELTMEMTMTMMMMMRWIWMSLKLMSSRLKYKMWWVHSTNHWLCLLVITVGSLLLLSCPWLVISPHFLYLLSVLEPFELSLFPSSPPPFVFSSHFSFLSPSLSLYILLLSFLLSSSLSFSFLLSFFLFSPSFLLSLFSPLLHFPHFPSLFTLSSLLCPFPFTLPSLPLSWDSFASSSCSTCHLNSKFIGGLSVLAGDDNSRNSLLAVTIVTAVPAIVHNNNLYHISIYNRCNVNPRLLLTSKLLELRVTCSHR